MKANWKWVLVIAVTTLSVAGSLEAQKRVASGRRVSSDYRIPVSKEPPTFVKGTETRINVDGTNTEIRAPEPPPAFRLVDYSNLNEQNLAAYLATRDSILIRIGYTATQKGTDPRVREFANRIVQGRTWHLNETWKMITEEHVGYDPVPNDYNLTRLRDLVAHFDTLSPGPAFDAAFLRVMYYEHQNETDVLSTNLKQVHDDDFEDFVQDSIKGFPKTRDESLALLQALGQSLP
jgi:predicted outer membrane protein